MRERLGACILSVACVHSYRLAYPATLTSARSVIAAILKRLAHRTSNVQLYALSLAEALSKNCDVVLHREIASRPFTQGLEKLVADRVRILTSCYAVYCV